MKDSFLTDVLFLLVRDHTLSVFLRCVLIKEHNRTTDSAKLLNVHLGSVCFNRCKTPFIQIVRLVGQIRWVRLCLLNAPSHLHLYFLLLLFFAVNFHMLMRIIALGFRLRWLNFIRVRRLLIYYLRRLVLDFLKILNAIILCLLLDFCFRRFLWWYFSWLFQITLSSFIFVDSLQNTVDLLLKQVLELFDHVIVYWASLDEVTD